MHTFSYFPSSARVRVPHGHGYYRAPLLRPVTELLLSVPRYSTLALVGMAPRLATAASLATCNTAAMEARLGSG